MLPAVPSGGPENGVSDDVTHHWPAGSFLGQLSAAARDDLLSLGRERVFAAKDVLIRQADSSRSALLLLDGLTKVTAVAENGQESLLSIRLGGDIVGDMAALAGMPRTATVTACGAVRARSLPDHALQSFLLRRPDASMLLTRIVTRRLQWANERRLEFRGYSVKVRLARILCGLAATHGISGREGLELGFSLTQPEMAALAGAAEPSIHKALRELRDDGLIITGYRSTVVRDLTRLQITARLVTEPR